jgi:hypothetical protein
MEEPLATSRVNLENEMKILGHGKMTCYSYLKRQFSAHEARAALDNFSYPDIGTNYRNKSGKRLKFTPSNGEDKHEHLKQSVLSMING